MPSIIEIDDEVLSRQNAPASRRNGRIRFPGFTAGVLTNWTRRPLVEQFLLLGGIVTLAAVVAIGAVVTSLMKDALTRNAAAATALYVDGVIAPLLPDMREGQQLHDIVKRALDETLDEGALRSQFADFRLWSPDGTLLFDKDNGLVGTRHSLNSPLREAFAGRLVAEYVERRSSGAASATEERPILSVYNPLRQPWSGEVVGVIELHEFAGEFQETLRSALLMTWLAVGSTMALIFACLLATVLRGSRTIDRQAADLTQRVSELSFLLDQNKRLHQRVQNAIQRATALNERYMRRLGTDLHDGPAQLIALASLRLDCDALTNGDAPNDVRKRELAAVRCSLDEALREVRSLCRGLVLPQVETASLPDLVGCAVDDFERRTGCSVARQFELDAVPMSLSTRICVYRFLQEGLNNGFRHCQGASQAVGARLTGSILSLTVSDNGPGFDPATVSNDSLGLSGLRDRIESVGGIFGLSTGRGGTTLRMEIEIGGSS